MSAEPEPHEGSFDPDTLTDPTAWGEAVKSAVALRRGEAGYVTADGYPDTSKLADDLTKDVLAHRADEMAGVPDACWLKRDIMQARFPEVPGPEAHRLQDNPALSEAVYAKLEDWCWRLLNGAPDGAVQGRLNSHHKLVLCHTTVNPGKLPAVYVTRDRACLLEDVVKPMRKRQKARNDRDAALTVMLIERVPEHGKRFDREMRQGLDEAATHAKLTTKAALAALETGDDGEPADESVDGANAGGDASDE